MGEGDGIEWGEEGGELDGEFTGEGLMIGLVGEFVGEGGVWPVSEWCMGTQVSIHMGGGILTKTKTQACCSKHCQCGVHNTEYASVLQQGFRKPSIEHGKS